MAANNSSLRPSEALQISATSRNKIHMMCRTSCLRVILWLNYILSLFLLEKQKPGVWFIPKVEVRQEREMRMEDKNKKLKDQKTIRSAATWEESKQYEKRIQHRWGNLCVSFIILHKTCIQFRIRVACGRNFMFSMYAYNIKETQTALGDPRKYGARSMFDAIYCIVFSTFTPLTVLVDSLWSASLRRWQ